MAVNVNAASEKSSVMKLCKEFGENTSMHGLGRAFASRSPCRRFVWSVMVVFGFGLAVFHFVDIMSDFYSYPVTTVVTLKHEPRMTFPAVTICTPGTQRHLESALVNNRTLNVVKTAAITQKDKQRFLRSADEISKIVLSLMLHKCSLNKRPCTADNFTNDISHNYGVCFTFISDDPKSRYTTKTGPQNGLILELNSNLTKYLASSDTVGVIVIVHEHDEKPFPDDGGILVQPGLATSIGIKKVVTRRLPQPYSTCVGAHEERTRRLSLFHSENYAYSVTACMKSCFQLAVYKTCKCCDMDLPCNTTEIFNTLGVIPKDNETVPYCNTTTDLSDYSDCIYTVESQYLADELSCTKECPPACDQITYEKSVSTAIWPSNLALELGDWSVHNPLFGNYTYSPWFVRTYFLRLEIYFDSLDFLEFIAQPKYDWRNLLGTVGGQLGLWLGFSLLTAMELIELVMDTALVCIGLFYRKHNDHQT